MQVETNEKCLPIVIALRDTAPTSDARVHARTAPQLANISGKSLPSGLTRGWAPVFRQEHAQLMEARAHPDSIQSGCARTTGRRNFGRILHSIFVPITCGIGRDDLQGPTFMLGAASALAGGMRMLACAAVLPPALAATPASTQPYDPDGRFSGGAPAGRYFGSFGAPSARSTVSLPGDHRPGTIVISTGQRRLYLMLGNGQALQYAIGVGRIGFTWSGVTRVSAKREWPAWTPPAGMRQRRPDLPRHMAGGFDNPLGARALYLGSTLYRIHGSNEPETIGQAVSSGCFRMSNEDVIDLYNRVPVGATVIVQQ
jgi:lipoprotein-anchoring transpeptidase ErfK/SrfK